MVTHEELYKTAAHAKLSLKGVDMDALAADMSGIIAFADEIKNAVTGEAETVSEMPVTVLRDDTVTPSLPTGAILNNAQMSSDPFFLARVKPEDEE